MFKGLIAKWFQGYIRGLLKQGLAMASFYLATMPADQIDQAKTTLKAAIQTLHKVPGELRKYACWEVDRIDAKDVTDLLAKLQALIAVLVLMVLAVGAARAVPNQVIVTSVVTTPKPAPGQQVGVTYTLTPPASTPVQVTASVSYTDASGPVTIQAEPILLTIDRSLVGPVTLSASVPVGIAIDPAKTVTAGGMLGSTVSATGGYLYVRHDGLAEAGSVTLIGTAR